MLKKIVFSFIFALGLFAGVFAYAQTPDVYGNGVSYNGANTISGGTGLTTKDPRAVAVGIVRVVLGFLGLIAVVIVLYGGWLYLTSNGDEKKIELAKKLLINGLIGLAIALASFGIATFILNSLTNATSSSRNGDGTSCSPACSGGAPYCCNSYCSANPCSGNGLGNGGGSGTGFGISNTVPQNNQTNVARNTVLEIDFNKTIDPTSVTANNNFVVQQNIAGQLTTVDGLLNIGGSAIKFQPRAVCVSDSTKNCWTANANFVVKLTGGIGGVQSQDKTPLSCTGGTCSLSFSVGTQITASAPLAIMAVSPQGGFCSNDNNKFCQADGDCGSGNICNTTVSNGATGNLVTINGSGFGSMPGTVLFGQLAAPLANDAAMGNPNCGLTVWTDNQIIAVVPTGAKNGPITVETANNLASTTSNFPLTINTIDRPGLCKLDPAHGKTGQTVDFVGVKLANGQAYFGNSANHISAISQFAAEQNGEANVPNLVLGQTSAFLTRNAVPSNFLYFTKDQDAAAGPTITSVSPLSGPIGAYITLRGSGFGSMKGQSNVYFGASTSSPLADYNFPAACANALWSDNQIIVKVPAGAALGATSLILQINGQTIVAPGKFTVNQAQLAPSLCRLDPSTAQPSSAVNLYGEHFGGDAKALGILFNKNVMQQTGLVLTTDGGGQKISATIPTGVISGPVAVVSQQLSGNSLNLIVGICAANVDCGGGSNTCCPAGSPKAGKCSATPGGCYGSSANCVYEWEFSTASNNLHCAKDQESCGTVCCAVGACEDKQNSKCKNCSAGKNQCGNGDCCAAKCNDQTTPSSCSINACSGYGANQCFETYSCPNSPGQCSPYNPATGQTVITGACDYSCNSADGCANGVCAYNGSLNGCTMNNKTCSFPSAALKDSHGASIAETGYCQQYQGAYVWQIMRTTTCPDGWVRSLNNQCVDQTIGQNPACQVCAAPFTCTNDNNTGYCVSASTVCPTGTTCGADNKCTKKDQARCDCCCEKAKANQDCCAPLTCAGSCGSQTDANNSKLGLCSGCAAVGTTQTDHDAACNCTGHNGKFCDASVSGGVCRDCGSIDAPAECTKHGACCVDANKNNACVGGTDYTTETGINYCAYYNCTGGQCDSRKFKLGAYNDPVACQKDCPTSAASCNKNSLGGVCNPDNSRCAQGQICDSASCTCHSNNLLAGVSCLNKEENSCSMICGSPYGCIGQSGCTGPGCAGSDATTCRCCCNPNAANDTCKNINTVLKCAANKTPCSGGQRGLCCGCSSDNQCGAATLTGCGNDTCCRARPNVLPATVPSTNQTAVCRNTAIEATFDTAMDGTTLNNGNILLIGDYGANACPAGAAPLALNYQPPRSLVERWWRQLQAWLSAVVPAIRPTMAGSSNYCLMPTAVASLIANNQTKLAIELNQALDAGIKYFVVIKGDTNLDSKNGVKSTFFIGLNGANFSGLADFNGTVYAHAQAWSFVTGNKICAVNKVIVNPSSYLFQQAGASSGFTAEALDDLGNPVQSIANVYAWAWHWTSDNNNIATVSDSNSDQQTVTAGDKKDADTTVRARATIMADLVNKTSTAGQIEEGQANIRLFFCQNPWPPVYNPTDWPSTWLDQPNNCLVNTGNCVDNKFQFYYCRDKGQPGINDDLASLISHEAVIYGQSNTRQPYPVLKDFYFFREQKPAIITNVHAVDNKTGNKITLSWDKNGDAKYYKIYYGAAAGQYDQLMQVTGVNSTVISGLQNNVPDYFVVSMYSSSQAEDSPFSAEVSATPSDQTPPAAPTNALAKVSGSNIVLTWAANTDDATSYLVEYGPTQNYAVIKNVGNVITYTIGGLANVNTQTWYLAVSAVDAYNNQSAATTRVCRSGVCASK